MIYNIILKNLLENVNKFPLRIQGPKVPDFMAALDSPFQDLTGSSVKLQTELEFSFACVNY